MTSATAAALTRTCSGDGSSSSGHGVLGCACTVRVPLLASGDDDNNKSGRRGDGAAVAVVHGTVLEVRRLWRPPCATSDDDDDDDEDARSCATDDDDDDSSTCGADARCLYAYVRVKERDHRHSGWYAAHCVDLTSSNNSSSTAAPAITAPALSAVYRELTPGMARTLRAEKQLDYLEERLLRDCKSPTTVRYFVYLGTYVFAPWYYAPYGLLHPEYDPLLPCTLPSPSHAASSSPSLTHGQPPPSPSCSGDVDDAEASRGVVAASATRLVNPYIRDAYLCPFSLRVYSTFAQLRYETATYRGARLRPPGAEIYRDEQRHVSLFEVDGSAHVTYCRHLLLLGKSFLENKLAGHDVHNYYFYVCCLHHVYFSEYVDDATAMYFAGYFSWEKQAADCNLACIVTLPCFASAAAGSSSSSTVTSSPTRQTQRRAVPCGIGQFMIAASYALAYRRGHVGSPERPLSDLGAAAYARYWQRVLLRWLHSKATAMSQPPQQQQAVTTTATTTTVHTAPPRHASATRGDVIVVDVDDDDDDDEHASSRVDTTAAAAAAYVQPGQASSSRKRPRTRVTAAAASRDAYSTAKVSASKQQQQQQQQQQKQHAVPPPLAGQVAADDDEPHTTVREVAREVGLDDGDVLTTLLTMGLLHRNAESRTLRLVIPAAYVAYECARLAQRERSAHYCVFDPTLLSSTATTTTTTTRTSSSASRPSVRAPHAATTASSLR